MTAQGSDGDYDVGYGKPPREHRFTKGRSGNPRGRPKGSKNIRTVLEDALTKTQPIREDGTVKHLPNINIIVLQLIAKALKGDIKATAMLLQLCAQYNIFNDAEDAGVSIGGEDRTLIASFLSRMSGHLREGQEP